MGFPSESLTSSTAPQDLVCFCKKFSLLLCGVCVCVYMCVCVCVCAFSVPVRSSIFSVTDVFLCCVLLLFCALAGLVCFFDFLDLEGQAEVAMMRS